MIFEENIIKEFRAITEKATRCVIVCHMTPDGDALGSSLCLCHTLRAMGKQATVIVPDAYPSNLGFLPGAQSVVIASYDYELARRILSRTEVIYCLDFNEYKRLDRFAPYVERTRCPKVMIDHHLHPSDFPTLTISHPEKSSTSSLLYMLLQQSGYSDFITLDAASCCCAGMMTDTGNFSYNSQDPDLYLILADMVRRGVQKDAIYKQIFETTSETRIRIMGYCQYRTMQLLPEHRGAIITLTKNECDEFGYRKGDTESLVNVPLGMPQVVWSVFLREMEPGYVKVSMRSKGDYSVRDICANHFGGGGHKNAAGGEYHGNIDQTVKALLDVIGLYDKNLPDAEAPANQ